MDIPLGRCFSNVSRAPDRVGSDSRGSFVSFSMMEVGVMPSSVALFKAVNEFVTGIVVIMSKTRRWRSFSRK